MKYRRIYIFFTLLVALLFILLGVYTAFTLKGRNNTPALEPALYRVIEKNNPLLSTVSSLSIPSEDSLYTVKKDLLKNNVDFLEADLRAMEISLYSKGGLVEKYPILAKGREGSYWETPSGHYSVLEKEISHFSSIGHVWMPWSMQFYGNFFIHGWPHYENGSPVPVSYSGGCIRLSTNDAKAVFEFAKRGIPLLVFDSDPEKSVGREIKRKEGEYVLPLVGAKAAFVADLRSGDVLYNKNGDMALPIASLTKLMTATVASELIYLERNVVISKEMLEDSVQSFSFLPGDRYQAFELFYPLLLMSSNGAGNALAGFLPKGYFVAEMNQKAKALSMNQTNFSDPSGVRDDNISSLRDISKLLLYIQDKRGFIFDLTRGSEYISFGTTPLSKLTNYNEFASHPRLIGMKNGQSSAAKQTLAALFRYTDSKNGQHDIFIGILGSENRKEDTERLLTWVESQFDLQ